MTDVKLEKISENAGIPGVSNAEPGWGNERWSDGTHHFLLQFSPKSCGVFPPEGLTNQTVVDTAMAIDIDYTLEPIIDGEVVTVGRDQGHGLMHAVYDALVAKGQERS